MTTSDGVVVISGDTRVCEEMREFARNADVLVHEACRATTLAPFIAGTARFFHDLASQLAPSGPVGTVRFMMLKRPPVFAPSFGALGVGDRVRFTFDGRAWNVGRIIHVGDAKLRVEDFLESCWTVEPGETTKVLPADGRMERRYRVVVLKRRVRMLTQMLHNEIADTDPLTYRPEADTPDIVTVDTPVGTHSWRRRKAPSRIAISGWDKQRQAIEALTADLERLSLVVAAPEPGRRIPSKLEVEEFAQLAEDDLLDSRERELSERLNAFWAEHPNAWFATANEDGTFTANYRNRNA